MSEDVDWAEFSEEEHAEMAVLVDEAERVLTPEERRAVAQESLFPIESQPNPYGRLLREQGLADGGVCMNWKMYRAALKRRLAAKKEG